MKQLTIAVPAYNSEMFLHICLDSMAGADDRLEVIVINDGSKDKTLEVANSYAEKYAVENEYIAYNPALKVKWAKESKPIIKTFTNKQAVQLSDAFSNKSYLENRNKTIIIDFLGN